VVNVASAVTAVLEVTSVVTTLQLQLEPEQAEVIVPEIVSPAFTGIKLEMVVVPAVRIQLAALQ
jgi:hypothetical protein